MSLVRVRDGTVVLTLRRLCFQAVSDLLLGVFCMPFTLLGQLLKNFVFGAAMCKLIPYFQGEGPPLLTEGTTGWLWPAASWQS